MKVCQAVLTELQSLQTDVAAFFAPNSTKKLPGAAGPLNLLEIACLGKPEMTLQGELLFFLRTKGWNCVQEAGYRLMPVAPGKRPASRNIDILVFTDALSDCRPTGKEILCCIELKHYSSNQGDPQCLLNELDRDYASPRPMYQSGANKTNLNASASGLWPVPILHVGMYSTLDFVTPAFTRHGTYRFARSIPISPKASFNFHAACTAWSAGKMLFAPVIHARPSSAVETFTATTGEIVSGWVEAFAGVRI